MIINYYCITVIIKFTKVTEADYLMQCSFCHNKAVYILHYFCFIGTVHSVSLFHSTAQLSLVLIFFK